MIYDIDKILRPVTKNIIQLPHDIEFSYKLYLLDNYKLGREYRNLDIVDILNVIACEWDGVWYIWYSKRNIQDKDII